MTFIGVNLTFFPQHFLGLAGMPRRIPDYPDAFAGWNMVSSIGAFILAAALLFVFIVVSTRLHRRRARRRQPWGDGATTLEWTVSSPPPFHNFEELPRRARADGALSRARKGSRAAMQQDVASEASAAATLLRLPRRLSATFGAAEAAASCRWWCSRLCRHVSWRPGHLHPVLALTASSASPWAPAASARDQHWYDADIDARHARGPRLGRLPAGRIDAGRGAGVRRRAGHRLVMLMGLAVNWVAAALLALTIAFYVFVYTIWLKRRTPQNIVIGGAAGALPPMVGWAAVTGDVELRAGRCCSLIIFLWTPPHFWALALFRTGDYDRAGVPMLPVVAGARETKRQMLLYTLVLSPMTLCCRTLHRARRACSTVPRAACWACCSPAFAVRSARGDEAATRWPSGMFGFSILYLFLLFAALFADCDPAAGAGPERPADSR